MQLDWDSLLNVQAELLKTQDEWCCEDLSDLVS